MSDELSLIPEYEFSWDNGDTRTTSEIDTTAAMTGEDSMSMEGIHTALEQLAERGRADEACTVKLLGYGN